MNMERDISSFRKIFQKLGKDEILYLGLEVGDKMALAPRLT